jgi:hypothetical protein
MRLTKHKLCIKTNILITKKTWEHFILNEEKCYMQSRKLRHYVDDRVVLVSEESPGNFWVSDNSL